MYRPNSIPWRRWFTWSMVAVLVISLATWYFTRDTLPETIIVATAVKGGMYHRMGHALDSLLEEQTGHDVQEIETLGSQENCDKLRAGEADIAIVQAGSVELQSLSVVAPLHRDVVMVLVRKELLAGGGGNQAVTSISDLAGRHVIVGLPNSGMQKSATDILAHYDVEVEAEHVHFTELLTDDDGKYDAAIVTTGLEAPNLKQVLDTDRYRLLPLDAKALEQRFGHFSYTEIPSNFWPPFPLKTIPTVSTLALVVVRDDASSKLVTSVLDCLHEHDFKHRFPSMDRHGDNTEFAYIRLHPASQRYHDPLHGFGGLASSVEAIAAGRELIVALCAGIFLFWERWRRIKDRRRRMRIAIEKGRLNSFLETTLRIEKAQMAVTDPERLGVFLDDVTEIKLRALDELSHEELADDRAFSIFLMQCANLISKIQLKIIQYSASTSEKARSTELPAK